MRHDETNILLAREKETPTFYIERDLTGRGGAGGRVAPERGKRGYVHKSQYVGLGAWITGRAAARPLRSGVRPLGGTRAGE